MEIKRHSLAEGVNLTIIPSDKVKYDVLFVNLILPVDPVDATYYSLLSRVLSRGTQKYPTMRDISIKLDDLYAAGAGATVSKKGESYVFSFSMSSLRREYTYDGGDVFKETLKLLSGIIFEPYLINGAFSVEYVNGEKQLLADYIRSQIDNKSAYSMKRCVELMCPEEPYSISAFGSLDVLESVNEKDLYEKYLYLLDNSVVEITYSGMISEIDMLAYTNMLLPFKPRNVKINKPVPHPEPAGEKEIFEEMDISQGNLVMGFRTDITLESPDYIKFSLFNELFGGGVTSKLFMNVREKQSLCYYCQSVPESIKGILMVRSGIDPENYAVAKEGIIRELNDIKNGVITETEFENAKKSLINAYREIDDDPSKLCSWYLTRIMTERMDSPGDMAVSLEKITIDDIVSAASTVRLDTVYFLRGMKQ